MEDPEHAVQLTSYIRSDNRYLRTYHLRRQSHQLHCRQGVKNINGGNGEDHLRATRQHSLLMSDLEPQDMLEKQILLTFVPILTCVFDH